MNNEIHDVCFSARIIKLGILNDNTDEVVLRIRMNRVECHEVFDTMIDCIRTNTELPILVVKKRM